MDFKAFQSILSHKIGILPHQFSVYIADKNDSINCVPITGKVNLSAISREMDSYFLVVLKRSRRSETRKGKHEEPSLPAAAMKKEPPANIMLLRGGGGGGNNLMDARVFTGFDRFDRWVSDLQMEKVRYLVNVGRTNLRIEREPKSLVCEDCENAKVVGRDVGFHWCVYDAVTFGFRSHAGPITRPGKGPV